VSAVLCIDIGGTRIKSAVIPENPSLEQVKMIPPYPIRTLGWLNSSLPELLKPGAWPGMAIHYEKNPYDRISISVPGPVDVHGNFYRPDLTDGSAKVPKQLKKAFEDASGKPVRLINDAAAWMFGFLRYKALIVEKIEYPALIFTFGTGVGVATATEPEVIRSFEINDHPVESWKKLAESAGKALNQSSEVHGILGLQYFDWVEKNHPEWSYRKMREEFTSRVGGTLLDLRLTLPSNLRNFRTLAFGGGNAEYVSVRQIKQSLGCQVVCLTDGNTGIRQDLIPLLGLEAASRGK